MAHPTFPACAECDPEGDTLYVQLHPDNAARTVPLDDL
jgi:hypothetical protein